MLPDLTPIRQFYAVSAAFCVCVCRLPTDILNVECCGPNFAGVININCAGFVDFRVFWSEPHRRVLCCWTSVSDAWLALCPVEPWLPKTQRGASLSISPLSDIAWVA